MFHIIFQIKLLWNLKINKSVDKKFPVAKILCTPNKQLIALFVCV